MCVLQSNQRETEQNRLDICPALLPVNYTSSTIYVQRGCVSNMREQRYAVNVRDTTEREFLLKKPEAAPEREAKRWRRQRKTETWRAEELCVRKFGRFGCADAVASVCLSVFDEAVAELISKPNSPQLSDSDSHYILISTYISQPSTVQGGGEDIYNRAVHIFLIALSRLVLMVIFQLVSLSATNTVHNRAIQWEIHLKD